MKDLSMIIKTMPKINEEQFNCQFLDIILYALIQI